MLRQLPAMGGWRFCAFKGKVSWATTILFVRISITLNASFDQVEQLKAVSTYDGAEIFEEISEKGA